MNLLFRHLLVGASLGLAVSQGPCLGQTRVTLDALVEQLRAYHFGQDRAPLERLEQLVAVVRDRPLQAQPVAHALAQVLTTDASYDAKQFVCRQLASLATEREVPLLARVLTDEAGPLAEMALYALEPIPGAEVNAVLRRALDRTTGLTQIGVINTLGMRRDVLAVPPLAALLKGPSTTAEAAAAALGKIGVPSVVEPLATALARATGPTQAAVADALLVAADRLAATGATPLAASVYARFYDDAQSPWSRAAGLRGLAKLKGAAALPLVLESLRDDGAPRQGMAVRLVEELPGASVTRQCAAVLPELSANGQRLLLGALARRGDPAAAKAVERLCASSEPTVRTAALEALGRVGGGSAVVLLAKAAAGGTGAQSAAARASLVALRGREVDGALVRALESPEAAIRVELVQALGQRDATETVPALVANLNDADPGVREASWRVLGALGRPADLPVLVAGLLKAAPRQREEGETTVAEVARRGKEENQRTAVLLEALNGASTAEDRCTVLRVLGQVGGARALAALRQAASADQPEVRLTVTRALAAWSTDDPLPDLLATVRRPQSAQQRAIALRGLIRLIGVNEGRSGDEALRLYQEAMGLAADPAEKRLVLAGLASLRSLPALEAAAAELTDAGVHAEAAAAVLQLARTVAGASPDQTRKVLAQLVQPSQDEAVRQQARQTLAWMDGFGDYITAWEVSPVYTQADVPTQGLFNTTFAPELPAAAAAVDWRLMPVGLDPTKPWVMDLLAVHGGQDCVAYLRTKIWSDQAQALVLELGSDDGVKVWLNANVVHAHNVLRGLTPDEDKVPVHLAAGWNSLLLKITQNVRGWAACARFRNPDGGPATGLRYALP